MTRRWYQQPMVQFMAGGLLLFILDGWIHGSYSGRERTIEVTDSLIESLKKEYTWQTGRPEISADTVALIDDYVKGEILYREALVLGLDRDDFIIRHRLVQKMKLLTENAVSEATPDDAVLLAYLSSHAEAYRLPARYNFRHIFIAIRGKESSAKIADLADRFVGRELDVDRNLGDPFIHGRMFESSTFEMVAGLFGDEFAKNLTQIPIGKWAGPLRSTYGDHLVLVTSKEDPRLPTLNEVRNRLIEDVMSQRRAVESQKFYVSLKNKYSVRLNNSQAEKSRVLKSVE